MRIPAILRKPSPPPVDPDKVLPPLSFYEGADSLVRYTPDAWLIERAKAWNVFVYGSEQRGLRHHRKLGLDARYHFVAYTRGYFASWVYNMGNLSFPVAMEDGLVHDETWCDEQAHRGYMHHIKGEMYTISAQQLIELDAHMLNTVQFKRKRATFEVPHRYRINIPDGGNLPLITERQSQLVSAWMYIGRPEFWDNVIDHGAKTKPTKVYRPSNEALPVFSHFSKLDYDERDDREAHSM